MGMNAQNIEEDDKFNYLAVMSESMRGRRKQKTPATAKGYQALAATDKCILVTHSIAQSCTWRICTKRTL